MKSFIEKVTGLIDVKTIVTFTVLGVFAFLASVGKISPENVMQVTLIIIAFFFAKKVDTKETK